MSANSNKSKKTSKDGDKKKAYSSGSNDNTNSNDKGSPEKNPKSMSANSIKSKKNSKDGDKKKAHSSGSNDNTNSNDKGSPEKDMKQYAGIGPDIIRNYAEQSMFETHLSDDVCNTLSEDINYKLRYIIHDALLKARLTGRDAISSREIEETFSNLSIEKVYGAPVNPNFIPFTDPFGLGSSDQAFVYLDDNLVNLIEKAEEEISYVQYGDVLLTNQWHPGPDRNDPAYKNYFTIACQSVISVDEELRTMTLKDISENPHVGPITQWFYNFAYFLLMKNITYDSLTLRALDLIDTLENSPLSSSSVSVKQLKLLVRLLLQRLLLASTSPDILRRMCFTLSILCLRVSLKEITFAKIQQKLESTTYNAVLPVLTIIYYLGIDAIREIFLPQMTFFHNRIILEYNPEVVNIILAIYGLICKTNENDTYVHKWFDVIILNDLVIYWKPKDYVTTDEEKLEINFISVKSKLAKTRRKVDCTFTRNQRPMLEEVFTLPFHNCKVNRKLDEFRKGKKFYKKQTHIVVGKTTLLLSVLNSSYKNKIHKCSDHSMLSYNL